MSTSKDPSAIIESQKFAVTKELDTFFRGKGFIVEEPEDRYSGASWRRLTLNDKTWVVAYKTDWHTARTGNIFIETTSVWSKESKKPGWVFDTRFDAFIYLSPQEGKVYWIPANRLRSMLPVWQKAHPIHEIPNPKYVTIGILVPVSEIMKIAKVEYLDKPIVQ